MPYPTRSLRHPALLALGALLLAACGGGGGGGGAPPPPAAGLVDFWLVALSDAALDGHVRSDDVVRATGSCGFVGDIDTPGRSIGGMQFFSFDVSRIPTDAIIDRATLSAFQEAVLGDPYGSHGTVVVDQVRLGPALQASDYWRIPIEGDLGVIAWDATEEWKSVDVAQAVRRAVREGWGRVEFRLRWSRVHNTNDDGNVDLVMFNDGEDSCGSGNRASLNVGYRQP